MQNIQYLMKTYDGIVPSKLDGILNVILNGPIKLDETRASIRKLESNKAAGTDWIPSEFFKPHRWKSRCIIDCTDQSYIRLWPLSRPIVWGYYQPTI